MLQLFFLGSARTSDDDLEAILLFDVAECGELMGPRELIAYDLIYC